MILTLNGGSSSIKLAVYQQGTGNQPPRLRLSGKVERIGSPGTALTLTETGTQTVVSPSGSRRFEVPAGGSAVEVLLDRLAEWEGFPAIVAVGLRVVHGLQHTQPERVTPALLAELRGFSLYDPEHLPLEIELIEAVARRRPELPQVACFDTAFHRTLPRVARLLPLPRRFDAQGVQRYGFHGLSYAYLLEELARVAGAEAARGRVILAHLGSGASLAAVHEGRSLDTTMGFTPTGGIPMSTRSGDLDPGLLTYLEQKEGVTARRFAEMANDESGLLGISETSADMRDLLELEATDERAAEAVALFCYRVKKEIGAFAAALGGLDALVFSAGIGENCPSIRSRACAGLELLGIELDEARNAAGAQRISRDPQPGRTRAAVWVLPTDEERMIERSVDRLLRSHDSTDSRPQEER